MPGAPSQWRGFAVNDAERHAPARANHSSSLVRRPRSCLFSGNVQVVFELLTLCLTGVS